MVRYSNLLAISYDWITYTGVSVRQQGLSMSTTKQRVRLRAHLISPLPLAAGLLVSGVANATAIATDDTFNAAVTPNLQVVGNVLANDTGTAPLAVTGNGQPADGFVSIDGTGNVTYGANACLAIGMTESFFYSMQDADPSFSQAMVTINIVSGATDDSYSTTANQTLSGNVRSNDLPTGAPFSITTTSSPTHGNLSIDTSNAASNGQFTYTPVANFSGHDQFIYSTSSSCNTSAQVAITVLPVAAPDTYVDPAGGSVVGNVLTNDIGTGLQVTSSTQPAHGTANVAPDGSFNYFPVAGFSGIDSFTYTVQDSSGQTVSAAVTISVSAAVVTPPAPAISAPATTPASLGLLATLMVWLGLRRRRRET